MKCNICKEDYNVDEEPGAVLWAPPTYMSIKDDTKPMQCDKYHACRTCWDKLIFPIVRIMGTG